MRKLLSASILLSLLSVSHTTTANTEEYKEDIKILSYNVFMLPEILSSWSQAQRATNLTESSVFDKQDIVVLNEVFDTYASEILLKGLASQYPYQTPVVGRTQEGWNQSLGAYSSTKSEDGGVAIVSKWPIVEKIQYIYSDSCGFDGLSNKGFAYVKINKNGRFYHVIGTHTQAEDSACAAGVAATTRTSQLKNIANFIREKKIDANEIVFLAGDFNIKRNTDEYRQLLKTLQVNEPHYAGLDATWDPKTNQIANYGYPTLESEYLDYIFVAKNYAQPKVWQNQAVDVTGPRFELSGRQYIELSDHYPVYGFAYASDQNKTQSIRAINTPYINLKIASNANGAFIKADPNRPDGWLVANGKSFDDTTSFKITNWYPTDAFCIRDGDYIKIGNNTFRDYYWNWSLGGGGGNYAYFSRSGAPSQRLKIHSINQNKGCLTNEKVAFSDTDTVTGKRHYLTRWTNGSWQNYIYLWKDQIGVNETFSLYGIPPLEHDNWAEKLIRK